MAFPTIVTGSEKTTSTTNQDTHTVTIPDDTTDGVANDDILLVFAGRDQQSGTPAGPVSPAYASGGWTVDANIESSSFSEIMVFSCVITDATELPTSDSFFTDGNRKTEWYAVAVRSGDYANRQAFTKAGTGNMDLAGGTTTTDDNLIFGGVNSWQGIQNDAGDITTEGSWTIQYEGTSTSGAGDDGGISVCTITQAEDGVLSDQELTTVGSDEWSAGTIVIPLAVSGAKELTGTPEAAAEVSATATQIHEQTATVEAAAEVATATATQTHEATAAAEAAAETTATATQTHELVGTVEAAAEATAVATQTHEATAAAEAAAEVSGAPSTLGINELNATLEAAAEVSGTPSVLGLIELTGTIEAASEATGTATQTHNATATIEAAAESVAVATQIHNQAGTVEAAAETTAAATLIYELTGSAEAAAESSGTATQTHNASAVLEAAAEASGVVSQTHNASAVLEAAAEVAGAPRIVTLSTKGFVAMSDVVATGVAMTDELATSATLTEEATTGLIMSDV